MGLLVALGLVGYFKTSNRSSLFRYTLEMPTQGQLEPEISSIESII